MDRWLTNEVKTLLGRPARHAAMLTALRLADRKARGVSIDERAITEDLLDALDTTSAGSVWGVVLRQLHARNIRVQTSIAKPTSEHKVGADLGITVRRDAHTVGLSSTAEYACLIQCKKLDERGRVNDFFHTAPSTSRRQSALLLDLTPSSFYFIYSSVDGAKIGTAVEQLATLLPADNCAVSLGSCGLQYGIPPAFPGLEFVAESLGVLVVPAMAVEAQNAKGRGVQLEDLWPNSVPLWYWLSELLIPGFVGDCRKSVLDIAANRNVNDALDAAGVDYSFRIDLTAEG